MPVTFAAQWNDVNHTLPVLAHRTGVNAALIGALNEDQTRDLLEALAYTGGAANAVFTGLRTRIQSAVAGQNAEVRKALHQEDARGAIVAAHITVHDAIGNQTFHVYVNILNHKKPPNALYEVSKVTYVVGQNAPVEKTATGSVNAPRPVIRLRGG